jgi:hypothetical protein
MPAPHSPDITMHELEKVGEACGKFAELLDDVFMPDDGLRRYFEQDLPASGAELLGLVHDLGVEDMFTQPGDFIGTSDFNALWDWEAGAHCDGPKAVGKLSLTFMNTFVVPYQPTSVSVVAHTARQDHFAQPKRMFGLSTYYKRGKIDGQQVVGLCSSPRGNVRAFRLAYWSYKDRVVYRQSIDRPSGYSQTAAFVSRARDLLTFRDVLDS